MGKAFNMGSTWHPYLQIWDRWIWWKVPSASKNWLDGCSQRGGVNSSVSRWRLVMSSSELCLGTASLPPPVKYSVLGWIGSWATWSNEWHPCTLLGGWNETEIPPKPNDSVILWTCIFLWKSVMPAFSFFSFLFAFFLASYLATKHCIILPLKVT